MQPFQLGQLMTTLKKDDHASRQKLTQLFAELQEMIEQMDEHLHNHLESEDFTRGYKDKLREFKLSLKQETCPVVVVGE